MSYSFFRANRGMRWFWDAPGSNPARLYQSAWSSRAPSPRPLCSAEGTQCPQTAAGAEGAQHPWGRRLCFVHREFSSCSLLLPLTSHPFPLSPCSNTADSRVPPKAGRGKPHSRRDCGPGQDGGSGEFSWEKNLTSPLPGRQAVCSPPMSWGWRCSGFCPLPSPKAGLLPASWQDFCKSHVFFDSVDNRTAKLFWVPQHRAEITANPGSVRVGGLISSAQAVLIYSRPPRVIP